VWHRFCWVFFLRGFLCIAKQLHSKIVDTMVHLLKWHVQGKEFWRRNFPGVKSARWGKTEEPVRFYFTIIPRSETNWTMNERRSISDDLWKELPTCKPWSGILQDTRNWFVIKLQSTSRTLTTFGMDNCHTQLESCYLLGQERQPHAVV